MSMKKSTKAIIGAAAGAGALLGVFNTVVYECMLNIRLASKIGEKMNPPVIEAPEEVSPSTEAAQEKPAEEKQPDRFFPAMEKWLPDHQPTDIYITNKKGQKRHAKLFNNGHPEKWAIIFHGFTSGPGGMYHYAFAYSQMGFNCILPSMIGHSEDENRYASMGWHDKYIGLDLIEYITTMYPDAEIVLHGESMGAATTMLITGERLPANIKCAVEDCGFTTVMDEYTHVTKTSISPALVPILPTLSVYSQLRGNMSFRKCAPIEAVKKSVTPTLFVHGEADDFVPFRMLNEVYTACAAEKDFFTVKGAGHAESVSKEPEFYWTNVYNFVKKYIEI